MTDWRTTLDFQPDPSSVSLERWIGWLPPGTDWTRLEDRLIAQGWYPKNAVPRLRVYGTPEGDEVVIEPASRQLVVRLIKRREDQALRASADALGEAVYTSSR
jgi:hypothetical protein